MFNEFLQNATVGNECPICSNHLNESHKSIIKKKQTVPIDQDLNLNTEIVHLEEKLDRLDRDKYKYFTTTKYIYFRQWFVSNYES